MPVASENPASEPLLRTHSTLALPNELLLLAERQWIFTESELLRTPSVLDGLTPEKERENRGKGVNFILQVGIMLRLPQITLATASVFLHRFYIRHSMVNLSNRSGFHYYSMAATSLFLATKVEENCRKMKELVVACVRVAQKDPHKAVDEQDKEYWRWKDNILHNEDLLLEAICFDLSLEPPYKTLFELLVRFGEETNKRLRNAAWAFINDSCLTVLCLLFPSRTIAASALYAAAKHCGISFPDDEYGRPWWDAAGIELKDIRKSCNFMAGVYENAHTRSGRDGSIYGRTPEDGDEKDAKTRAILGGASGLIEDEASESGVSSASVSNHERRGRKHTTDNEETVNGDIPTNGASVHHRNESFPLASGEGSSLVDVPTSDSSKRRKLNGDGDQANISLVLVEPSSIKNTKADPLIDDVSEEGEVEP